MSDPFGVNDYKMTDLVFYTGLFAGVILGYRGLVGVVEWGIARLIIGGILGMGLGWGLQFVYARFSARDRQHPKD